MLHYYVLFSLGVSQNTPCREPKVTTLLSVALILTVCKNLFVLLAIDVLFVSFQESDLENPSENFLLVKGARYGILATPRLCDLLQD